MSEQGQQFDELSSSSVVSSCGSEHEADKYKPILSFLKKKIKNKDSSQLSIDIVDNATIQFKLLLAIIGKEYVQYKIEVKDRSELWTFFTRYKVLDYLNVSLRELFPGQIATFPRKSLIGNLDQTFVTKRGEALQYYLNSIVQRKQIIESTPFKKFLDQSKLKAVDYLDYDSFEYFRLDD